MEKLKFYIVSMRLRTLPLSLAGVCLGAILAFIDYRVSWQVILFLILTSVSLQILSNLSNELGDSLNKSDLETRQGPLYGLDSGKLTIKEMKSLIGIFIALCIVFGLFMLYFSFGTLLCLESICFALLGGAAIFAALKYTLGRNPYGYRGLGDLYVFLFFGFVSVLGSYFVCAHEIPSLLLLLPSACIGFFSVGVLNVNNIRDMKTDIGTRTTVAIRLGLKGARIYQLILIVFGWGCMLAYASLRIFDIWHFLFVLTLPLFIIHIIGVFSKEGKELDKMLPLLSLSTLLFSILTGIGFAAFFIL